MRTLANAMAAGRIHHAFVLTGIRGIGKTTTARIIARALNCIGADGQGGPTTKPCGVCPNCTMIAEDRHPDVLEMDAASRTGVGDIRELIDTVRYAPTAARYKIYIIDEVHMLSTAAFNALLKTLEEPPPHVKFIFATTEARKIPVTILSRCQRFDLRRITEAMLAEHLGAIAAKENEQVMPEALALMAQAAEGSVRDGLSLLDQALAQHGGAEPINEIQIRAMLGLADRAHTLSLLALVLEGKAAEACARLRELYAAGADPLLTMQDLLEFTHFITRIRLTPAVAADLTYAEAERALAAELAAKLSMPVLTRLWQMLLKTVAEVKLAPSPIAAAEMALVRIAYAAELPTPAELVAQAQTEARMEITQTQKKTLTPILPSPPEPSVIKPPAAIPPDFPALVAALQDAREALLAGQLQQFASLVDYAPPRLSLAMETGGGREFAAKLASALEALTGAPWQVILSEAHGAPTLKAQAEEKVAARKGAAATHPLVLEVMTHFPGTTLVDVQDTVNEPA